MRRSEWEAGGAGVRVVDLHGQSVAHALESLRDELAALRGLGEFREKNRGSD